MSDIEKKHYIYVLKLSNPKLHEDSNWTDEQNKIAEEHFMYLENLVNENIVVLAGRTIEEDTFGIIVFKAETWDDALKIMNNDPAVKNKLMTAELHGFSLALLSRSK